MYTCMFTQYSIPNPLCLYLTIYPFHTGIVGNEETHKDHLNRPLALINVDSKEMQARCFAVRIPGPGSGAPRCGSRNGARTMCSPECRMAPTSNVGLQILGSEKNGSLSRWGTKSTPSTRIHTAIYTTKTKPD